MKKRIPWIMGLSLILLSLMSLTPLMIRPQPPLPVLGKVPRFELTDSRGKAFGLDDLSSKIWVIDFIFTTCPGPCPAMTANLATVHQRFAYDKRVHLVSVTVNPGYDSAAVLAHYAKRYHADTSSWHFLTGAEDAIHQLARDGFKIGDPDDISIHSQQFALVDAFGQIRGYYLGTDAQAIDRLKDDIKKLRREITRG